MGVAAAVLALVVSLVAPFVVIPWLRRVGAVDTPSDRSLHTEPAVRGVGFAPLLAVMAGFVTVIISVLTAEGDVSPYVVAASIAIVAGLLGAAEDIRGLSIRVRAGSQFGLGVVGGAAAIALTGAPWWLLPVFAVGIAGYINVANFMDGVNGISSLHGLAVGGLFVVVGQMTGTTWLAVTGAVIAVSFLGFLPWNILRPGTFLGDVGSYLLGGVISISAVVAVAEGLNPVAVVAPMAIYLADTSFTLTQRIRRGERWTESHRSHVFQRLVTLGLSHLQSALIVTAATVLAALLGLIALRGDIAAVALSVSGIFAVIAVYLTLPVWVGRRSSAAHEDTSTLLATPHPRVDIEPRPASHRWAVLGASGFIGGALVAELTSNGFEVVELAAPRMSLDSHTSADDVVAQAAMRDDAVEALARSIGGVDIVVNAAGLAVPDSGDSPSLYGANSLLPLVVAQAAAMAGVHRVVHLSSAAVQGRRAVLDESSETAPFSPYSRSKALGEAALLSYDGASDGGLEIVIVRATSVQGVTRSTTQQLKKLARSPLASIASPGDLPTVVSSVRGLVSFILKVATHPAPVPVIVLQPWEGLTTADTLRLAGGKNPVALPAVLCRALIGGGYLAAKVLPPIAGPVRRVELMWFGQAQNAQWAASVGMQQTSFVADVLRGEKEANA
ncbi:NAD-dependent epimerase/dehydratase family protein [Conyzicola nivalis]|uniref:NAD-dependent epimerase/dehydratase family protein n=1 Tax=Conyzicola nivalis TaxID=1477021 RepID=UPI001E4A8772|nr:NAD-dependent epimerase/dehydratase family protein [Conyzicola nivalis]